MTVHPLMSDVLLIEGSGPRTDLTLHDKEIIVGLTCGLAVLRGADVYGPGVLGAPKGETGGLL